MWLICSPTQDSVGKWKLQYGSPAEMKVPRLVTNRPLKCIVKCPKCTFRPARGGRFDYIQDSQNSAGCGYIVQCFNTVVPTLQLKHASIVLTFGTWPVLKRLQKIWSLQQKLRVVDYYPILQKNVAFHHSDKIQNGDVPVLANPGPPGKWPLKQRITWTDIQFFVHSILNLLLKIISMGSHLFQLQITKATRQVFP